MYNALLEAGQIVDELLNLGIKSYRLKIDESNVEIIKELQVACHYYPGMLEWSALGSVNSEIAYFTLHNKFTAEQPEPTDDNVIHVDFRARRVAAKQAA